MVKYPFKIRYFQGTLSCGDYSGMFLCYVRMVSLGDKLMEFFILEPAVVPSRVILYTTTVIKYVWC